MTTENPYLTDITGEDVREVAWTQCEILDLVNPAAGREWDQILRDMEDDYCTREIWLEAISEMRKLV